MNELYTARYIQLEFRVTDIADLHTKRGNDFKKSKYVVRCIQRIYYTKSKPRTNQDSLRRLT